MTAAWLAQDVPCEVVVATAGDLSLGDTGGARLVRAAPSLRAPGLLRNAGAAVARGRMLYLSDADVAPLGRDYLSRALAAARRHGGAWAQPWMYRIDASAPHTGAVDLRPRPSRDGRPYCMVTASPGGVLRPLSGEVIVRRSMLHCGAVTEVPVMYPTSGHAPDPEDRRDWRAPFHWGAMLLEHRLFDEVGGYCRRYYGWGGEDDDLFVKVASRTPVTMAWSDAGTDISCLHFEHSYPYSGTPEREANSALYARRTAEGPDAMIEQDVADVRSAARA
ncbi:galactosyltransferase-related protein [Streptomyces telluris]|uniref:Galactosyltransferase-related protein n=2 Tax=Streptomyces telluris TaxID=2720021 RepID=A0A9X2RLS2_9ACTN|nr:galactosyltransferase-related protein [Streptomyces telluris]MCQ8771148.1 galactosyltransferase-related protein [Streptomyces telluris]